MDLQNFKKSYMDNSGDNHTGWSNPETQGQMWDVFCHFVGGSFESLDRCLSFGMLIEVNKLQRRGDRIQ